MTKEKWIEGLIQTASQTNQVEPGDELYEKVLRRIEKDSNPSTHSFNLKPMLLRAAAVLLLAIGGLNLFVMWGSINDKPSQHLDNSQPELENTLISDYNLYDQ